MKSNNLISQKENIDINLKSTNEDEKYSRRQEFTE